ncbi:PREDICTED: protein C8orf37 homolog [Cyprinodon variegatus]|uniref:protein C8orf37 homolog n=1 Tax=Cyprinodon variegatus TaxID=28743 RepID=UPI000742B31F|nr:PREDICTED: protein C8orf37 homolog [Cyprinodon variegatus]
MDKDDLDELLDEVERKFCGKVSAACSDEKHNKRENKLGERSAATCEEPKSSISEDIDALLEELLEDDYSSSPPSKKRTFYNIMCCPVFIGGSSVTNGVGTATSKRSCDQLRCISCDFRVLMFDDSEWDASCDYLFLRNNMPDRHKLRAKLKKRKGLRAYACQCNWFSSSEAMDLRDQPQLRWVCGKHKD